MDNQQPTRILVAGATGNLGKALIPVLHARGCEVVALVRPGSESRLEGLGDHLSGTVKSEVTTPDILSSVFNGIHTVISSIGISSQHDGLTYDQVDYEGNLNLLRGAEECGVQRFVYVSVVDADKDVDVPLIRAKRRFEEALIGSKLEWQIVRPSGFFTDLIDIWKMALKGTVDLFGDGESKITPIHTVDLAEVIVGLLEAEPGKIVPVGGPADFTWNEIAELACCVAGQDCKITHWPVWLLRRTLEITSVFSGTTYEALSFLGYVMTTDTKAPKNGSRSLEAFFNAQQKTFWR